MGVACTLQPNILLVAARSYGAKLAVRSLSSLRTVRREGEKGVQFGPYTVPFATGRAGLAIVAAGKQGGVLDRPGTFTSPAPNIGEDTRKARQKKKPRFYKVLLWNDQSNRREYVVRVLLKVIKGMSVDDAVNVMQQAHMYGSACVISCAQEEAERYCEGLRTNGLIATIEPSGTSGSGGENPPA